MSSSVLLMLSSKSFIVSGLTFRSLIHFEFIFVYDVRKCSNFILLHVAVQFSQQHLLKGLSLPHCIFLPPLSNPQVQGFISGLSILFHWSVFLFLCQYHTVFINVALQYNLVSKVESSSTILLSQDYFGYLGSFVFLYELYNFCSSSVKNAIGNMIGITLNLQIMFGSVVIFTILILPTQEHGLSQLLFT